MKRYFLGLLLLYQTGAAIAQTPAPGPLATYLAQGLATSENGRQARLDVEKARWALREAKRRYGPDVDAVATYTRNFRQPIPLPTADPNNPISAGLAEFFRQSNSVSVTDKGIYLPAQQQFSGAVQLTQPLYSAQLKPNVTARQENLLSQQAALAQFELELRAEIKSAYFQYLKAQQSFSAYEQAQQTAAANYRTNLRLVQNQKLTKDNLYKAKSRVSEVSTAQEQARNAAAKAQAYLNFLANRPLEAPVPLDSTYVFDPARHYALAPVPTGTPTEAESFQLQQVAHGAAAAEAQVSYLRADARPDVQLSALAGVQGTQLNNNTGRLPLAQVQVGLKWDLFDTGVTKARIQQSELARQQLQSQYQQVQQQLTLAEYTHRQDVQSQLSQYAAVQTGYQSARITYEAVQARFQQGLASFLEVSATEDELTQARVRQQVWYYDLLLQLTAYEKAVGRPLPLL